MVDSGFESDQSVFSPTLPCRAHQFASYWSSHFCNQLDFSGLLNQLLLVHWLYSFQNFDGVFFCFMFSPTLFVSIFIPIVLLYCHLMIRDKCLCSVHVFNWNFSKFLILSLFHALFCWFVVVLVFLNNSTTYIFSIIPRLPDRWSKIDQRI